MDERESIRKMLRENPDAARFLHRKILDGTLQPSDTIKPDKPIVVIGGPSTDITGSRQYHCAGCHNLIWISPSGQEQMAKQTGDVKTMCLPCVIKSTKPAPGSPA